MSLLLFTTLAGSETLDPPYNIVGLAYGLPVTVCGYDCGDVGVDDELGVARDESCQYPIPPIRIAANKPRNSLVPLPFRLCPIAG